MSDHVWVLENLEAHFTGGLEAEERGRLDRHVSGCKECARELTDSRGFDQALQNLFAEVRPAPALESRMIQGLRAATWKPRRLSLFGRIAASVAAVLLLGVLGLVVHQLGLAENLRFPGEAANAVVLSKQLGMFGGIEVDADSREASTHYHRKGPVGTVMEKLGDGLVGGTILQDELALRLKEMAQYPPVGYGQRVDGSATFADPMSQESERKGKLAGSATPAERMKELEQFRDKFDNADMVKEGRETGAGQDKQHKEEGGRNGPHTEQPPTTPVAPATKLNVPPVSGENGTPSATTPKGNRGFFPGKSPPVPTDEANKELADKQFGKTPPPPAKGPGYFYPADDKTPGSDSNKGGEGKDGKSKAKGEPAEDRDLKSAGERKKVQDAEGYQKKAEEKINGEQPKKDPDNGKDPAPASRKIIRTGDIEYEIDDFDRSVATVTRMVTAVQGAFVATINSDKLANGKVKGSMVVRTPPDKLDKFLLDLRQEFAKTGELKNQRIGSQDITKQFYDVESRLRAARTMEDRLISIIKTGKGEIKDLLAAERELGVWRTKIEEMEGETRYYNNQVSLSTLTINLAEKEIRAAAAMVISERVNMRIEVEDVEKSLQAALAAVTDVKGRVTRSDLKKHPAGQYEAILHFEVAPAAVKPIRAKLDELGVVTQHDAERLQQAEGGTNILTDTVKSRQSDVQYNVVLYNVANIQPRETHLLTIAAPDVPAAYRKLQDEVAKAKGQVRVGQLVEQDKQSASAQLDFDVPSGQRDNIDKLLAGDKAGLGDVAARSTTRVAPGETATDRKIGYRITFKNFAGIPARETYVVQTVSLDVPAAYRKLQDAIADAKGQVTAGNLSEQDKQNISAQLDFDVPASARESIEKLLTESGDIFSRTTNRAAQGEAATDRKVGYRVTLKNFAGIPPRDTFVVQAVSVDVPGAFHKLQDAVGQALGRVNVANLNEQDRQNISAQLDFDVPADAAKMIEKTLTEIGDIYARTTNRAAPGESATDRKVGYRLTLRDVAGMPPREKVTLAIEVKDVEQTAAMLKDMVKASKGTVVAAPVKHEASGIVSAVLLFDVPLAAKDELVKKFKAVGTVRVSEEKPNPQVPLTKLATAHINVMLASSTPIVPSDEGVWPQIRTSLSYSFKLLSWSLMFIILGLSVVLPWALLLWLVVKVVRRMRRKAGTVGAG